MPSWIYKSLPIILLAIINFLTFKNHYIGKLTFPWDFLGGYHAHAYEWTNGLRNLQLNSWIAWSDIGFPSSMAIQSSAWYLPVMISNLFTSNYSIYVATVIQAMHVFFGALGIYFVLRSLRFNKIISLICAVLFHFSVGFYSNQQHIDIVRAYAIIPWLILFLNPNILLKNYLNQIILILVASQFLLAAYPGIIVSTFYTLTLVFIFFLKKIKDKEIKKNYIFTILFLLVIAVLISLIKWLPFFSNFELLDKQVISHIEFVDIKSLLSIFYNYTDPLNSFSGDITMSGIYISSLVISILLFNNSKSNIKILAYSLLCLYFIRIFILPYFPTLFNLLPGLKISRFPLSDWRFTFYFSIILFFAGSLNYLKNKISLDNKKIIYSILFLSFIYFVSKFFEFNRLAINQNIYKHFIFLTVVLFLFKFKYKKIFFIFLLFCITFDGYDYNFKNRKTWQVNWNEKIELENFNTKIPQSIKLETSSSRPERLVIGNDKKEILKNRNNSFYNACFYNYTFCLLGYNNLKLSIPHKHISNKIALSNNFFDFIKSKQHLLYIENTNIETVYPFISPQISDNFLITSNKNIIAKPIKYSPDNIIYYIKTPVNAAFVENEIWWTGWMYEICDLNNNCNNPIQSIKNNDYLRVFSVPAGEWYVKLHFKQKWLIESYFIIIFTLILLFVFFTFKRKLKIK